MRLHNAKITLVLLVLTCLLLPGRPVLAQARPTIIFLHHSCGLALIDEGNVREGLTARGYDFYDHGYNDEGLRLPDGTYAGRNFDVPGDNTDPDGYATIFSQSLHDPPDNTFSYLMQYDVIVFKSCFPVSNIADDDQLAAYQSYYRTIRDRIDQHPEKLFIVVTQPPQVPGSSDRQEAARARAWTQWLQSAEFLAGHPNLFVFDFFGYLAGDDNFLRREYRYDNQDAHPNARANQAIGPLFVDFIDQAIRSYEPGVPIVQPPPTDEPTASPLPAGSGGLVLGEWGSGASSDSVSIHCQTDPTPQHNGGLVTRVTYNIPADNYADCGQSLEAAQDWSQSAGFGLWLRAETPGPLILTLYSGPDDGPTPFDVTYTIGADGCADWVYVFFPWGEFARAQWAEEGGLSALDPARITGYSFTLDAYNGERSGTLLLDLIGPTSAGAEDDGTPPATEPVITPPSAPEEEAPAAPRRGLCSSSLLLPLLIGGATWLIRQRNH